MKTGLYIGRFQPFHNGHLAVIKQALTSVDHLYIGIGSSNVSNDENPFTFEQRKEMIMTTLEAFTSQQRYTITAIPDFHNNERWMEFIAKSLPTPDVVFSGNPVVIGLFEAVGIPVYILNSRWSDISGTEIRGRMITGAEWRSMVPNTVANIVLKLI